MNDRHLRDHGFTFLRDMFYLRDILMGYESILGVGNPEPARGHACMISGKTVTDVYTDGAGEKGGGGT